MSTSALKTHVHHPHSHEFDKHTRRMVDLLTVIKNEEEQIRQGGGRKAIESQHKKGRLNARERIAKLIDPGSSFFELSIYAAYEMYEEWEGAETGITPHALESVLALTDEIRTKYAH